MRPRAKILWGVSALFLAALATGEMLRAATSETARTHTVVIEQMTFSPAELRIRPGDRVVFENKDLVPHTATAKNPPSFDSGLIKAGESWMNDFAGSPRTIHYVCLYHATMEGRIIVEQP